MQKRNYHSWHFGFASPTICIRCRQYLGTKLECRPKRIHKPKPKKNESSVQNV
jgi:hypothetical protein